MIKKPDKTLLIIGKNLRRVRKAFGISQERLALEAEVDRTYVSQIERGIANPSILMLKKIADCLKVGLSELTFDA
ncbi:helix-turn-helix domain-containing protein [Undibacterium sp. SXout11W]|uniref:helix-turn-helix domain-containing protein n=1 Tax=Undibacterium sp. SXout11W TaxID=3413050 RepID=UPI003BF388B6